MKRILYSLLGLSLVLASSSCSKDENLNVDLDNYNYDDFGKLPVDDYIFEQLTSPYNIEVVYRFDRSHTEVDKDISPPKIENVPATVDMIRDGFIKVYEDVAGETFIKTYTPKQFVLFGSHAYNSNGTVTLGTADGGRRIVLYDINNLSASDGDGIKRRLRTIHHEFTHIVNQIVPIPPSFRTVTTDYVADWVGTDNTEEAALELGFVSRYSRSSFGEDFAETVAHLLVNGQAFYDSRIANSTDDGAEKLREKQSIVMDYFKQFLDIDFKELQYKVQLMLENQYHDNSQTLMGVVGQNLLGNIHIDPLSSIYTSYGRSEAFNEVWEETTDSLAAVGNAGRKTNTFRIEFPSANNMQIIAGYTNTAGSAFNARYNFEVSEDENGNVHFEYFDDDTDEATLNNGRLVISGFQPLIDYFEGHSFKADWLPRDIVGPNNWMRYGGFFVVDEPDNFVYGPVTIK